MASAHSDARSADLSIVDTILRHGVQMPDDCARALAELRAGLDEQAAVLGRQADDLASRLDGMFPPSLRG